MDLCKDVEAFPTIKTLGHGIMDGELGLPACPIGVPRSLNPQGMKQPMQTMKRRSARVLKIA